MLHPSSRACSPAGARGGENRASIVPSRRADHENHQPGRADLGQSPEKRWRNGAADRVGRNAIMIVLL
jgi:hypothetical protein